MDFISNLRELRESPATALFLFHLNHQAHPDNIHAFFEGHDDCSFYTNFLNMFATETKQIHPYKCGGKKEVYETFEKVKYSSKQGTTLFFVDKDLSDIINESYIEAPNIYVTDHYSIENYLVTEAMLFRIWHELMHFKNCTLIFNDIHKEKFRTELERFYQFVLPITAWIIYMFRNGKRPNIKNINFSDFFILNHDLTLEKTKELLLIGEKTFLERKCGVATPEGWASEAENILLELSAFAPKTYIRGKLELCFFVRFIKKLVDILDLHIQTKKGRVTMFTQISDDNALEILGPRLTLPSSLREFLHTNLKDAS